MTEVVRVIALFGWTLLWWPVLGYAERILPIEYWQTTQGAQVYFIPVHAKDLPMLDVNMVFAAGSGHDAKKAGLAHLTNHLVLQGSQGYSADQIAEQFEYLGARVGNSVDRDKAILSLRTLSDAKLLQPALKLFAHVVAHPTFSDQDFKRERNNTLTAIKVQSQTPATVADLSFFKQVYKGLPYAHPIIGTTTTVSQLSAADSQDFYRQYYVASNASIVLVGAVSTQQAKVIAQTLSAALPQGSKAPAIEKSVITPKMQLSHIPFPVPQSYIRMGHLGINYHDADYFPLYVGNYILGGGGLVSRLFHEVREQRGLSYGVRSYFYPLQGNGLFYIGLQTRNDQTAQAIKVVHNTLTQLMQQGPSEHELLEAKQNIINGYPLRFASNANMSACLVRLAFYNLPLDYYETYTQHITAVSKEQIKDALQRRVHPDDMVTVIVGKQ